MKGHIHKEPIIAWANGEEIQYWHDRKWCDVVGEPCWSNYAIKYRAKPKPLVLYSLLCTDDNTMWQDAFETIKTTKNYYKNDLNLEKNIIVKITEVIEE